MSEDNASEQIASSPQQVASSPQKMASSFQKKASFSYEMASLPEEVACSSQQVASCSQEMASIPKEVTSSSKQNVFPTQELANIDVFNIITKEPFVAISKDELRKIDEMTEIERSTRIPLGEPMFMELAKVYFMHGK